MEFLSRIVDKFPLWNAGIFLAFAGVSMWAVTRMDEEARGYVESRRHLWESTSTYQIEYQKARSLGRLAYSIITALNLLWAIAIVCAYALVR